MLTTIALFTVPLLLWYGRDLISGFFSRHERKQKTLNLKSEFKNSKDIKALSDDIDDYIDNNGPLVRLSEVRKKLKI